MLVMLILIWLLAGRVAAVDRFPPQRTLPAKRGAIPKSRPRSTHGSFACEGPLVEGDCPPAQARPSSAGPTDDER